MAELMANTRQKAYRTIVMAATAGACGTPGPKVSAGENAGRTFGPRCAQQWKRHARDWLWSVTLQAWRSRRRPPTSRQHDDAECERHQGEGAAPQGRDPLVGWRLLERAQHQLGGPALHLAIYDDPDLQQGGGQAGPGWQHGSTCLQHSRPDTQQEPDQPRRAAASSIQPLRSLTARKAPVAERDQPMPDAALRRKKGSGTSNQRSRAPNRKTRERERMLTLGLLLHQG